MPPIGTVGIAAAAGVTEVSRGAALLFGTNLVAIVLGAATTFRIVGVHGSRDQARGRLWVRRALMGLLVALCAVTVPLVTALASAVGDDQPEPITISARLRAGLERHVERSYPGISVLTIAPTEAGNELEVLVASSAPPPADLAEQLAILAADALDQRIRVHVVAVATEWAQTSH